MVHSLPERVSQGDSGHTNSEAMLAISTICPSAHGDPGASETAKRLGDHKRVLVLSHKKDE
jgi:hypothetical protein